MVVHEAVDTHPQPLRTSVNDSLEAQLVAALEQLERDTPHDSGCDSNAPYPMLVVGYVLPACSCRRGEHLRCAIAHGIAIGFDSAAREPRDMDYALAAFETTVSEAPRRLAAASEPEQTL